jgi:probable HAF family extracellular repeat protein
VLKRFVVTPVAAALLLLGAGRAGAEYIVTDLGTLGGTFSNAYALNDAGEVVGSAATKGGMQHAFLYSGGKMTDLGSLGGLGVSESWAYAINASGQVLIHSAASDHTFLYTNGAITDLGFLGNSYSLGGSGINNAGQVVGSSNGHGYLYASGKTTDVNNLVPADSHWTLFSANAINNKGQIVGNGMSPNGEYHAYLLTPTAEAPEPGSLALMGLGALGLAARAWRRRTAPRLAVTVLP